MAFLTVGHSNRSLEDFIDILRAARVEVLVDVRSFPRSRSNPQFNIDHLPEALAAVQIRYSHCPDLGGRRAAQKDVDAEVNGFWRVRSFQNYADYALGETFQNALDRLLQQGRESRVAMMCSEAVWWRCHRRIITDYLLARGQEVTHLMGEGREEAARLTDGAVVTEDRMVIYPAKAG